MELVIMAAGMGSRFGGLKQLESIDDNGNFIIDYSIFDAIRVGFDKIVFVISKDNYDIFKTTIGERISKKVKVSYVFQSNENLKIDRQKPLGTGYAVLLTINEISGNFSVINADDYYGYECFEKLAKELKSLKDDEFCMGVFKLKNTLSSFGNVTRGVCSINNNYLQEINECEVTQTNNGLVAKKLCDNSNFEINNDTPVSMNIFGFSKNIFNFLESDFNEFLKDEKNIKTGEFFLPTVVTKAIKNKLIKVKTFTTNSKWLGLTYLKDVENVRKNIKELINKGNYPKNLWK